MAMTKKMLAQLEERKNAAIAYLRSLLKPGSTVYTFGHGWNRSSTGRHVAFFVISKGKLLNISAEVSNATGYEWLDHNAVLVSSSFRAVSQISTLLHGNESKGAALEADRKGYSFTPDRHNYRAGYSLLEHQM